MSDSEFGNITYESEKEKKIRSELVDCFMQCPIPDDEILSNLGLFLNSKNLSRILSFGETGLTVLFSFFGLGLGFAMAALISRKMSAKNRMIPIVDQIIQPKHKPPSKILFDSRCQTNVCPHA